MSVFDSRQKTSASLLGAVLVGGKCGDASFARTDTDHDGKVSRAEFLAVAKDRAGEFDSIDSDHDGFISEAEAYEHLRKTYEANGKPMPAGLFSKLEQGRH